MKLVVSVVSILTYLRLSEAKSLTMKVVSKDPPLFVWDNVLSASECQVLMSTAAQSLVPSQTHVPSSFNQTENTSARTSSTFVLPNAIASRPLFQNLNQRLAALISRPEATCENLQIQRYLKDQHYVFHYDHYAAPSKATRGQRVATLLIYLNDVNTTDGGETIFPYIDSKDYDLQVDKWYAQSLEFLSNAKSDLFHKMCRVNQMENFEKWSTHELLTKSCRDSKLFRISPKKGRVVGFFPVNKTGQPEFRLLHGACPLKSGEKWVAQKWFHDQNVTS